MTREAKPIGELVLAGRSDESRTVHQSGSLSLTYADLPLLDLNDSVGKRFAQYGAKTQAEGELVTFFAVKTIQGLNVGNRRRPRRDSSSTKNGISDELL